MASITVRGARQHNLKNLELALPRDKLIVITGPSGSGKSSLAFDTLYAEAQRRYVESLSVYARQFLGQLPKPDVDGIDGLSPAICVRQQGAHRNPRSTVGTMTEVYDYLRLLFARLGVAHSPHTGEPMRAVTAEQVVDELLSLPETKLVVVAPLGRFAGDLLAAQLARLRKDGFVRVQIDGAVHDLGEEIAVSGKRPRELAVQVDRLSNKIAQRQRLSEAVELAFKLGDGLLRIEPHQGEPMLRSEQLRCVSTGERFGVLTPRTFSFNSPEGACASCAGLGHVQHLDPALLVPDPSLSLRAGAMAPWGSPDGTFYQRELSELLARAKVDADKAWEKLSAASQKHILLGAAAGARSKGDGMGAWEGVVPRLENRLAAFRKQRLDAHDEAVRDALAYLEDSFDRFASEVPCPACEGTRLQPVARHVTVHGATLVDLVRRPLSELLRFFEGHDFAAAVAQVAGPMVRDICYRLRAVVELGLPYLQLDRSMATLSGGEIERIRLATQLGLGLVGVLYVLDEPSAGLHPRDNDRLIASLRRLCAQGNTLVVVEHDLAMVRAADHVVDLGPSAGEGGGELMAQGTPEEVRLVDASPTGRCLRRGLQALRGPPRAPSAWLQLSDVTLHNVRSVSLRIPVGALTCVTGVSGSGKSTLIIDALLPAVRAALRRGRKAKRGAPCDGRLSGAEAFDRVLEVDQAPIGRTPRSSPASYLGALDDIRELFASLPEAKARGYGAARFSFNVKGGRCELCRGDGLVRVDMEFLPDTYVWCEACRGRRYNRETLEVRYRGLSIADVLDLSADAALELFGALPKLAQKLSALCDVGLGYLRIGQASSTLSGGEAQRVKLARELARRTTGRTLLVLDEPTAGLHLEDVAVLTALLQRLVDAGNTVVVIEHHLQLAASADHVIDLGPEGGPGGGTIICEGAPEQIAACTESHTGRYLAELL